MLFLAKRYLWSEAVALLALLALTRIAGPRRQPPSIKLTRPVLTQGLAAAMAIGLGDLAILATLRLLLRKRRAEGIIAGLQGLFREASLPAVIGGSLVAGLGEEPLFRGVLQARFGLLGSAVAFAIAHMAGRSLLGPAVWAAYDGLALGLVHRWSGNLAVPMLAHALHDLAAGLALKWGQL